jgi:hypothetical protein
MWPALRCLSGRPADGNQSGGGRGDGIPFIQFSWMPLSWVE